MSHENLMYAMHWLTPPYCENHQGGEDASYQIKEEERKEMIDHRLNHEILPKTTEEAIHKRSVDFFGEGRELPYVIEGVNGLEERKRIVKSLSEM